MFDKLAALAVPPWVRIVVPLVLVAAVFFSGMWLQKQITSGTVADLKGEVKLLKHVVAERDTTIAAHEAAWETVKATLATNTKAQREAEEALAEYLARPPEVITRWRTAATEVPDAIPSGVPCAVQVHASVDLLQAELQRRSQ